MTDLTGYYTEETIDQPYLMTEPDGRNWTSDCSCSHCKDSKNGNEKKVEAMFEQYNNITLEHWDELTFHQYLLCPVEIKAFVFATRKWGKY